MSESNGNGTNGKRRGRLVVRRPLAVDLFSGAGGLSLGLEQAGFNVVASVEYDPVHAATHKFNFPLTEVLCRDLAKLESDEVRCAAGAGRARHLGTSRSWDGEIDLIAGGPPCQGYSMIGKRLIDDPRNRLVFHFFRIVRDLRPRYFVMENVPGIAIGGHSSILEQLIGEFEAAGYSMIAPIQTLNAAEYGAPQERRRVFLIGARSDQRLPEYPAPLTTPTSKRSGNGTDPNPPYGPTVWDAIGDLPDLDEFPELLTTDEVALPRSVLRRAERRASAYARILRGLDPDPSDLSYPREWVSEVMTSAMRTKHTSLSVARFTATTPGSVEPVSRFQRLDPAGLCNTLRAGTGSERGAYTSPRPIHPKLPRVISVREAARLHSFPDWFRLHRTKWHGFRQIGNAVVPRVGRAVGEVIVAALGVAPAAPTAVIPLGSPDLLGLRMSEAAACFSADLDSIPRQRKRTISKTAA